MRTSNDAVSSDSWQMFNTDELIEKVRGDEPRIFEFLRAPTLSCSVYHLPAGSKDMQSPHLEDEVYFVVAGRAVLKTGDQQHEVKPGSILYVKANTEHSFFDIQEDLTVIALFGAQFRA